MSCCSNCGAYIPDGFDECTACGTLTYEAEAAKRKAASATQSKKSESEPAYESGDARKDAVAAAAEAARKAAELAREEIRKAVEPNSKKSSYKKSGSSFRSGADKYYDPNSKSGADRYYNTNARSDYNEGPKKYSSEYDADARENKSLGAFCYLGPLLLIPFLSKPDSQFLRYHCNQGLVLTLFCILVNIAGYVPLIGWMMSACGWIAAVTMFVKGLKNVSEGKRTPLPLIGDITIIK